MPISLIVIKALICAYALQYGVEPEFAMAVANVESRVAHQEFRVGPMGRGVLAGPMGLNRDYCFEHFGVDPLNLDRNIEIGVKALRGKDKRQVLRRYNTEFNVAYWRAVREAESRYRKEGIS